VLADPVGLVAADPGSLSMLLGMNGVGVVQERQFVYRKGPATNRYLSPLFTTIETGQKRDSNIIYLWGTKDYESSALTVEL